MTNTFLNALENEVGYGLTYTENGAVTRTSTGTAVYDLFAMGAAYRSRSEDDVINLFVSAFDEDPNYALKCLFYLRDILEGQGERRFFRVCVKYLANKHPEVILKNMVYIPQFGRWDDLYELVDTPLEEQMFDFMRGVFYGDMHCKTPSLLAKWMKSENTSSKESRILGVKTRKAMHMDSKEYRKTLASLRERIRVVEKLMSENRWDEIEFDKIPSKAGMKYRNAFARRDIIKEKYKAFAADDTTKVNAKALYPYEVVKEANRVANTTDRNMINKYWDNLTDYFNEQPLDALAVVDTSASMWGLPMDVAISLGLYCADKARGPFHGNYISFSANPKLVKIKGYDFCDKVRRLYDDNLCENTNIEAVFDLLLNTAISNQLNQEDLPKSIIIISDMEFDAATRSWGYHYDENPFINKETLIEGIVEKWKEFGYDMPHLIFWNVSARQDNIPIKAQHGITFVSGCSPVIFQMVMSGKSGIDLMYDKLNSDRYKMISA